MTPNEITVASCMSNMEYRSISQIAKSAKLTPYQVGAILRGFCRKGFAESQLKGLTTYYRLK